MDKLSAIVDSWQGHIVDHKIIANKVYAIQPFMYTYGILLDIDTTSIRGRYCFGSLVEAKVFFDEFTGWQVPIVGVNGCTAIKV